MSKILALWLRELEECGFWVSTWTQCDGRRCRTLIPLFSCRTLAEAQEEAAPLLRFPGAHAKILTSEHRIARSWTRRLIVAELKALFPKGASR